ncbi:MAG: hypothetical protein WAS33_10635, partial [Candidatus Promineifilaceae bacterium]
LYRSLLLKFSGLIFIRHSHFYMNFAWIDREHEPSAAVGVSPYRLPVRLNLHVILASVGRETAVSTPQLSLTPQFILAKKVARRDAGHSHYEDPPTAGVLKCRESDRHHCAMPVSNWPGKRRGGTPAAARVRRPAQSKPKPRKKTLPQQGLVSIFARQIFWIELHSLLLFLA